MKKIWIVSALITVVAVVNTTPAKAQAKEIAQLALNIEKLAQFKQILSDLKKGYEILSGGYNTIKNISEGNFKLHKVFLDGLLEVNPAIEKYRRVADIVDYQVRIVKEYKAAFNWFKENDWFNPEEITYIGKVYNNIFNLSLKNLDDLFTVITVSDLRMSDDERLAAIDKIHLDMQDKLQFLRSFNSSTSVLALQRAKEKQDVGRVKSLY